MSTGADFTIRVLGKTKGAKDVEKALGRVRGETRRMAVGTGVATKATGRFQAGARRAREESGRFASSLGRAGGGGAIGALSIMGGNLMTKAVEKVAGVGVAMAGASLDLLTFGQNSRLALGNLSKHGAGSEKLFEHARALAVRFGLDVLDTTKQYQKFLALQFTPKGADKLVRMGADMQALGASGEQVKSVFLALGKIKSQGRVQGDEMMMLAEAGVSTGLFNEEVAKALGKNAADVPALQRAGKISADVAFDALEKTINRKLGQSALGESGAKFADKTIDGMLGRLKALGQDSGLKVVDRAAAPITKVLGSTLDKLVAFIESPKGGELIDKLAGSLERMATAGAELGGELATKFIEADWKAIGGEILDIANGMIAAARAGAELAKVLGIGGGENVASASAAGPSASRAPTAEHASVGGFAAGGALAGAALGSVVPGIGTVAGGVVGGIAGAGLAALENVGVDIGVAISDGMSSPRVTARAHDAGVAIGDSANRGTKEALGIHSPSRVAMADGVQVARGMAIGMRRGARHVDAAGLALAGRIGPDANYDGDFGPAYGPAMSSMRAPQVDGAAGGGRPISVTQHIEVNGTGANAEEVARLAARESRRELESFFRQLALEV